MRVKLTYLVPVSCFLAHTSQARPGGNHSGSAVMKHDEAKKFLVLHVILV